MATVTTAGAGNWSSTTPDTPWPGGTLPSAGDAVVINHAVTWDNNSIPRLPATAGTFLSLTFGAAGQLICGAQVGAIELYATTITAGAIGTSGSIAYSGTACDSLTITCTNLYGCPSGGSNPRAIVRTSTKPLTFNGNCTGGAVSGARAIQIDAAGAFALNGNVYGGAGSNAFGCVLETSGVMTATVTSTVIKGGSATTAAGIYRGYANTTLNITSGSECLIEGGTGAGAAGVDNITPGTVTLTNCNLKNGTGGMAWRGVPPSTWTVGAANYIEFASGKMALEVAATDLKLLVVNGTVTGTLVSGYTVNGVACS